MMVTSLYARTKMLGMRSSGPEEEAAEAEEDDDESDDDDEAERCSSGSGTASIAMSPSPSATIGVLLEVDMYCAIFKAVVCVDSCLRVFGSLVQRRFPTIRKKWHEPTVIDRPSEVTESYGICYGAADQYKPGRGGIVE